MMKAKAYLLAVGCVYIAFAYFHYWHAEPLSVDFFIGQHDETLGFIFLWGWLIIHAVERPGDER